MLLISRRQGGVWEERAMGGLGYDEWEGGDDVFLEGGGGDVRWFCTAIILGSVKGWRKAILQGRGGWVRADAGRVKLIPHSGQVANIFFRCPAGKYLFPPSTLLYVEMWFPWGSKYLISENSKIWVQHKICIVSTCLTFCGIQFRPPRFCCL